MSGKVVAIDYNVAVREDLVTMMGALHHVHRRVDRIYCEDPGDEE